jgi:hypothetical protein
MFALGFWISASLVIDFLLIPSLLASGMMEQSGFISVGYLLFGLFNHLELFCAALILSGFLIFNRNHSLPHLQERWSIILSGLLLGIALIYTYGLTPALSGFGFEMNLFNGVRAMPTEMITLQWSYWLLEIMKIVASITLLRWCYRDSCQLN